MPVAVAVMDRPQFGANTDVLVVADAARRELLWVPRDLWCEGFGNRVNKAYAAGGHECLAGALAEHGIGIDHSLCLLPDAIAAGLEGVTVAMPVQRRMEFWYPLAPQAPIAEGRKRISFDPPVERLAGERIHQWIGARYRIDAPDSDLGRIRRQQQLIAVMLGDGFDFGRFLAAPEAMRISDQEALAELALVRWDWSFETVGGLRPKLIAGKDVLVPDS